MIFSQSLSGDAWAVRTTADATHVPVELRERLRAGIAASVPGCAHTDLMAAGLLDDPYLADNELRQYWIGRVDWTYERVVHLDAATLSREHVELVCDGLDTIATVTLNGAVVGTAANMHCTHRFDLNRVAVVGANRLTITFAAPMTYAESQDSVYPDLPRAGGPSGKVNPHNLMRKMSCNMGWDWGPEVTTSGIWRPIRVEAWDVARLRSVRPLVMEASADRAVVDVRVDVEGSGIATATLRSPDGETFEADASSRIVVPNPRRWWPVGHGAQPLYTLDVELRDAAGRPLDRWSRRIGLRTTALDVSPDTTPLQLADGAVVGGSMQLRVNGKAVYCKGANWIPDDCFVHRVTPERYRARIEQALGANMNMLRVWGGGLYEDDAFYDACDALGMMVWQDFLFACACYPEAEPYRSLVEAEARDNIARLSSHASLVIWNGCNENVMAVFDWGPQWVAIREDPTRAWGLGYYLDLLPGLLRELDPSRPYWPASPYSGSMERHPQANEFGNVHIWDVWHGTGQYRNYLAYYPRMASEFGYHGPACYATIAEAIPAVERWWNSPTMQLHNKNGRPGQLQTNERMADDFLPPVDDYDAWHFLAQVMQARALSMGIEWFRALAPWNAGALFWQLNDCYPVSSWSAIDGRGRAKPLLHAARRFFAPRLVTIKPRFVTPMGAAIGALSVYLHNDADDAWAGRCVVRQMSLGGETLATRAVDVRLGARESFRANLPADWPADAATFLVAEIGDARGFWWFAADYDMPYDQPRVDASLTRTPDGYQLSVRASSVIRDLCVFVDRLDPDAVVSDAVVTLLPGDTATFDIATRRTMTLDALTRPPVMNCANRFGRVLLEFRT